MKEQDSTKMEFLLTLNDNIVVQRFFNVRGYNPKAKNSLELYDFVKRLKESLEYNLKMKTVIYMMDNKDAIVTSIKALGHLLEGSFSEVTYTKPAWDLSPSTNRYKFVINMSITGHSKQEVDDTFTEFRTMASDTFSKHKVSIDFHWDIS